MVSVINIILESHWPVCTNHDQGFRRLRGSQLYSVARFMDLSTICGFLEQKIVCGWIKAKSRVL